MHTFTMKKTSLLLVILIVLAGLTITGLRVLAAPVTIDLCASNGQITMPDGVVVNIWGFVQTSTCGPNLVNDTNFPGQPIAVFEGDTVTINVTNALPTGTAAVPHTISFEIPGIAFDPGPTDAAVGGDGHPILHRQRAGHLSLSERRRRRAPGGHGSVWSIDRTADDVRSGLRHPDHRL